MEMRDSGSHRQMSCPLHLGLYALGKRFWKALDTYSGDHGKVDRRIPREDKTGPLSFTKGKAERKSKP